MFAGIAFAVALLLLGLLAQQWRQAGDLVLGLGNLAVSLLESVGGRLLLAVQYVTVRLVHDCSL